MAVVRLPRAAATVAEGKSAQNSTAGVSRAASSASKYSRSLNVERSWRRYTVGNCWSLLLYSSTRVVVELPGVGDAALGGGQLLLQGQEVLVGLQVGVRLAQREQLAQGAGELALGSRLWRRVCGAATAALRAWMTASSVGFSWAA